MQLVKPERGKLWLPEGQIVDWPDVGLREVFWDEQEHLDHLDVMNTGDPARGVLQSKRAGAALEPAFRVCERARASGPVCSFAGAASGSDRLMGCAITFR